MLEKTALELGAAIKKGELTTAEVAAFYAERIKANRHNAFTDTGVDTSASAQNTDSPLCGVPIGIKDNISTAGVPTTCASLMLKNYRPVFDATVVEKLKAAGMIPAGKLNMDQFAMGSSSETTIFDTVLNPWDTERVPGGSSGGSAAAVAAGEVPIALGSDTGGSIRQPCSFCGITGIKPTYGSVSRYGLIAFASSLDQIGVMGRNIDDCAAVMEIISGPDERDSTCVIEKPFDFSGQTGNIEGLRIGLPSNYLEDDMIEPDVKAAILEAVETFKSAGAIIEEFVMPYMEYVVPTYYAIACAEASSNLSRYDGLKYGYHSEKAETLTDMYRMSRSEGFGMEVKRRIMLGSFVLSSGYYDAYYKKALQARTLIKDEYNRLFEKYDMILTPVATTTAYKIGENIGDPVKMYMGDIYTVSVNLAGLPAVSLPCGFDSKGLPIGLQLIGNSFEEPKLINASRGYQKLTDFHTKLAGGAK